MYMHSAQTCTALSEQRLLYGGLFVYLFASVCLCQTFPHSPADINPDMSDNATCTTAQVKLFNHMLSFYAHPLRRLPQASHAARTAVYSSVSAVGVRLSLSSHLCSRHDLSLFRRSVSASDLLLVYVMASQAVRNLKEQATDSQLSKLRSGQVTRRIESILFPDEPLHVPKGGQTGEVGQDGREARLELQEDLGGSSMTGGLQSDSFGLLMTSSLMRPSC